MLSASSYFGCAIRNICRCFLDPPWPENNEQFFGELQHAVRTVSITHLAHDLASLVSAFDTHHVVSVKGVHIIWKLLGGQGKRHELELRGECLLRMIGKQDDTGQWNTIYFVLALR